jgi:vancomycin resistance protein YoaR
MSPPETARSHELPVGYGRPSTARPTSTSKLPPLIAAAFALASIVLIGFYITSIRAAGAETPALSPDERLASAPAIESALAKSVEHYLDAPISLTFDGKSTETTWRALGGMADPAAIAREADRLASAGIQPEAAALDKPVPVAFDPARSFQALVAYKDRFDRPAVDARMDLEKRQVIPEQEGYGINVYASLASLEDAARTGLREAPLEGGKVIPQLTLAELNNVDISHVMGWFETRYPPVEKDRNYNLKVAAEKVNGTILMPGEEFSFNAVVGDRTEKEGYRVAHVITAGEMVDGLAGGTCQVSSTLHGAAWFAGLELVNSRPHSRPSAYITMALDATVVYPTTDLKLKNPYDFPIVIRYVVSQGTMRVEVLGKKRPWDKVAFEREIKKEIPYETITREDDTMPVGSTFVEQVGFPGYELIRRRIFYKDGKEAKAEKWTVKYPPTTEYIRIGVNMDPNMVAPKQSKLHGPMDPGGKTYRMVR